MNFPYLSLLVLTPVIGSIIILFVPKNQEGLVKNLALTFTAIPLLLVLAIWAQFDPAQAGMQLEEVYSWIPRFGVNFHFGVDGISLSLLALTALIGLVAVVASWNVEKRVKDYFALLLFLQTGILGVFCALDYILFFVFWEIMLVPMYFLIGIWGHENREYAATKFFIYTFVGSMVLLIGILALYFQTGAETMSIQALAQLAPEIPDAWRMGIFLAMLFGFAVKVPVAPFHTWLPDAHVEAPTPISMVLAGVLLKTGAYGFLRITHPTFPDEAILLAFAIGALGVFNIVYGALVALAQTDAKKLVAYSSISHMGFVLLGVAAATELGINGAIYTMISHGLISPMMFFMVGVFYERTHTREIPRLGGLFLTTPVAATLLTFAAFANLGLPGLSGFIAEFFTLAGTIGVFPNLVYMAVVGMILVAAFNLLLVQRTLLGEEKSEWQGIADVSRRESGVMAPLMLGALILGLAPAVLINILNAPVLQLAALLGG